jgi:hypothetical protein
MRITSWSRLNQNRLAEIRRAQALDPLSFSINVGLGWCLYHARRNDDAIAQYRSTFEIDPNRGFVNPQDCACAGRRILLAPAIETKQEYWAR